VEVYLADQNSSAKSGNADQSCVLEARLGGLQPISVSDQGASLEQALDGAADKLQKALDRALGRLEDAGRGRLASRDDGTI
jgi:ribosome-associated translation inhibitor RaiA